MVICADVFIYQNKIINGEEIPP